MISLKVHAVNLLLDTHAFRWFVGNDPRFSSDAKELQLSRPPTVNG